MPNEFKIKNGFLSEGDSNITGSLNVSAGITGSLLGTASFALAVAGGGGGGGVTQIIAGNNVSISPAGGTGAVTINSSGGGASFPFTGSAQILGSLGVTGSINDLLIGKGNGGANGASNISIGLTTAFSSSLNTAAINNIALGSGSMLNLNSGSNNIALGQNSLRATTSGSNNIAFGENTLCSSTTGRSNVAIGQNALRGSNQVGNIAIGYQTLQTGSAVSSIAIGFRAGARLNGSSNNLLIGYRAGYGATGSAATTTQQNIAIGTNAGCSLGTRVTSICNYISEEYGGYFRFYNQYTCTNYNTFIGYNSGRNICPATPTSWPSFNQKTAQSKDNVAIGLSALCCNTEGYKNNAIGNFALRLNTIGAFNTAIGVRALYSNTTGCHNIALGYNSLRGNSTGANNIAIGRCALQQNTTATNNTVIGSYSLYRNTTGCRNTAIGACTNMFNRTGTNNVAIGYMALRLSGVFDSIGTSNTVAIGYKALSTNSNGTSNTAIGSCALACNYNGGNNTAIGFNALRYNSANFACNNTAVGACALAANDCGTTNTAVGDRALRCNTQGISNTAVGSQALCSNTTGCRNTAIGFRTLERITTGIQNVAVGRYAGRYSSGGSYLTSLCNSVLLGHCTRPLTNGDTNEIVIGFDAIGSGSNTTVIGNSSTTSTCIWGRVTVPSLIGQVATLTPSSNTASLNLAPTGSNFYTLALTNGTTTHLSASNIPAGQTINIRVTQDTAGTGKLSFSSAFKSGSFYTGSAVANAVDIVTLISFNTSTLFLSAIRNLV
jgi:hypothetical protein